MPIFSFVSAFTSYLLKSTKSLLSFVALLYNSSQALDVYKRQVESFMLGDGTFDYSKDKYAVSMMKKCLALGNIDTLIFFANSPHYTQTVTGQTSGGFTERFSNLDKSKYEAFAEYFIDIAEHFISEGYPVKYISPINEPQWKWGGDYVWQEGCHCLLYTSSPVLSCVCGIAFRSM